MAKLPDIPMEEKKIEGVFSIEKSMKIGAGTTARRVKQAMSYFAKELDGGVIQIQPVGSDDMPVGSVEEISKDDLLRDYMPDPASYKRVMVKMRDVQKSIARGEKFRKRGETFTAEFEFNKALAMDEQNVRANFGVGMCYIERGEKEKAQEVFERIVKIDAAFGDEHKHLFNEYGIKLRKNKMFADAVEYYKRALELTKEDENLYYNIARAEFESENYAKAADAAGKCLALSPDHVEGTKLLAYLGKKGLV
jgi:tetratricopeptide (TPR) repeat protein